MLDAYGVGVRAGVLTPQADDEIHIRAMYGLPAIGAAVASTWDKEPVRRPITLAADAADESPAEKEPE